MDKIVILKTNRSEYSVKEAAKGSITVGDLIEILRNYHDLDAPIVFSNDNGYTYGYITESVVDEEFCEDEPEEEDLEMQRPEMEYEMFNAVRKNNDNPVKLIAVASDDGEKLYISLGYNDSREFGVFTDEEAFVPFDELSDDEVYSVYVSLTRW